MAALSVMAAALASVVASSTGQASDGMASLRIENVAARVVVIPERRATIAVAIRQGSHGRRLETRQVGPTLVIDGAARSGPAGWWSGLFGLRCNVASQQGLPVITAHVPVNAQISASGAIYGEIGPSSSLILSTEGCGGWKVADVSGALDLNTSGSGGVRAGAAQVAKVRLAGSGAVGLGRVQRQLDVDLAGSGGVHAARSDGPLKIKVAGSGGVTIDGGHAPTADIAISGSGDVAHRGTVGRLNADVKGSGDVKVREVLGQVESVIDGSGDVHYGRPAGGKFCTLCQ